MTAIRPNWTFVAAVALAAVYVILIIAAGAEYASGLDTLASAGGK